MTKGDSLPLNIMGTKIDFLVDSATPAGRGGGHPGDQVPSRHRAQAARTQASRG